MILIEIHIPHHTLSCEDGYVRWIDGRMDEWMDG
jgi:hypothetical protein